MTVCCFPYCDESVQFSIKYDDGTVEDYCQTHKEDMEEERDDIEEVLMP